MLAFVAPIGDAAGLGLRVTSFVAEDKSSSIAVTQDRATTTPETFGDPFTTSELAIATAILTATATVAVTQAFTTDAETSTPHTAFQPPGLPAPPISQFVRGPPLKPTPDPRPVPLMDCLSSLMDTAMIAWLCINAVWTSALFLGRDFERQPHALQNGLPFQIQRAKCKLLIPCQLQ